jgi:8-oxo-dGTP pyrophosphatase MutT (NUDIX family)
VHDASEALLRTIGRSLGQRRPRLLVEPLSAEVVPGPARRPTRASVALVVRPAEVDIELLLIKRATVPGDPWSGHMAFPGGRQASKDPSARHTAVREAREEVGLDLEEGSYLGQLDDVTPRPGGPDIVVSSFVFSVGPGADVRLNHEVALAVWVPLQQLADPRSATDHVYELTGGTALRFPAIRYEEHVIWGLTHRIIAQFLDLAPKGPQQGGSRG